MNIVRLGAIAGFANLVNELNGDLEKICQLSGLQPSMLEESNYDAYLPQERLSIILNTAVQLTNCYHFGLQLGLRKETSALGVLGILIKQCKTVRHAIQALVDNLHIHAQDSVHMEFFCDDKLAVLRVDQNLPEHLGSYQVADLINGCSISLMKSLCGPDFKFHEVRMTGRQRPSHEVYLNVIKAPVKFAQAHNELVFDAKYLDIKLNTADAQVAALLDTYLGERQASHKSLTQETLAYLRRTIGSQDCHCESTAAHFALSKRTYNRKLTDEGTSFKLLLQQVKSEVAKKMIIDRQMSISATAEALGYSDVSSFNKAFKSWYGQSPKQWQMANKANV